MKSVIVVIPEQHVHVALTQVFPADVKPARAGVYVTHVPTPDRYSRWDGTRWMAQRRDPLQAAAASKFRASYQAKTWQGLSFEVTA